MNDIELHDGDRITYFRLHGIPMPKVIRHGERLFCWVGDRKYVRVEPFWIPEALGQEVPFGRSE